MNLLKVIYGTSPVKIPLEFGITVNDNQLNYYIAAYIGENGTIKPEIRHVEKSLTAMFLNAANVPDEELEKLLVTPVDWIKILPGSKVLIPSGVHVKLPTQVFLVGENKSGIASKRGLIKAAQVIDTDYEGQIHINMINPTANSVFIKPGEKIIQFVPYFQPNMTEAKEYSSKEALYKNSDSIRGEGGFGSSGI